MKIETIEKIKAGIRLVVSLLVMVLSAFNITADPDTVTFIICIVASVIVFLWVWWKNNNVTKAAVYAQDMLNLIKENKDVCTRDTEDLEVEEPESEVENELSEAE